MSLQLPEGLMQALQGAQGGPPPPGGIPSGMQSDQGEDQAEDPLEVLQDCIQGLPKVIASLPDPQDTQDATQALLILTKIQTHLMARNQSQGQGGPQPQGR